MGGGVRSWEVIGGDGMWWEVVGGVEVMAGDERVEGGGGGKGRWWKVVGGAEGCWEVLGDERQWEVKGGGGR